MQWSPGVAAVMLLSGIARSDDRDRLKVGVQDDGRIVVPTNQILKPAGKQITFLGRPVALAFADDGRTLIIKNMSNLVFLDLKTGEIRQTLKSPVALSAVGLVARGPSILVTDAANHVRSAVQSPDGKYKWGEAVELTKRKMGVAYPTGLSPGGRDLWVASNRGNGVQRVDFASSKILDVVAVGVAPYGIVLARPDRLYVWAGHRRAIRFRIPANNCRRIVTSAG